MATRLPRFGPWKAEAVLGHGGMGSVWRARSDDGRIAALKSVRAASPELAAALRREIESLAELDHPGVVRILDHGLADGLPWMAMELVPGRTLRERIGATVAGSEASQPKGRSTWWTSSLDQDVPDGEIEPGLEDWRDALRLVRRLCGPVGWLHGEGIVHRDLKPDNVILDAQGWPVVVDFGVLARPTTGTSRDGLALVTRAAGTLAYIAPEQLAGRVVDARADLFSLGCILYELLGGAPPYRSRSTRGVGRAHLLALPTPLSELRDDLPEGLDALVSCLLDRMPEKRLACAEAVADALVRLGAPDEPLPGPRPRPHLYRTRFAGRGPQLHRLRHRLRELAVGRGGVVLVGGPSGVGKTRLLVEVAQEEAPALGLRVLTGECLEGRSRPLEGLLRPLEAVVARAAELEHQALAERIAPHGPALQSFLSIGTKAEGAPSPDGWEAQARTVAAARGVLTAEDRPLVLLLDDVQWADELVRAFVSSCADHPLPILVVAAHRIEDVPPEIAVLGDRPGVESIALGPLGGSELASLAADMLALPATPAALGAHLAAAADGNAFFAAEIVRAAVTQGLVTRDPSGAWRGVEDPSALSRLPADLDALVAGRLAGVDEAGRRDLEAAAVIGRIVPAALFGSGAILGELRRLQLLEPVGDDEVRFVHDRLREVVLRGMTPARYRERCGEAAAWVESLPGISRWRSALGALWEGAGDEDRAARAWLEAAHRSEEISIARNEFELAAAIRLWRGSDAELRKMRITRARRLVALARIPEAAAQCEALLAECRAAGDLDLELSTEHVLFDIDMQTGGLREALARGERMQAVATAGDLPVMALWGRYMQLEARHRLGVYDRLAGEAFDIYVEAGARGATELEGTAAHLHAALLDEMGRWREARARYTEILAHGREWTSRRVAVTHNIGLLEGLQGDHAAGLAHLREAWDLTRSSGARWMECYIAANLGNVLRASGDVAAALDWLERALRAATEQEDPRMCALARAYRGIARIDQGRYDDAREDLRAARSIAESLGDRMIYGGSYAYLVRTARLEGDLAEAMALAEEAESTLGPEDGYYFAILHGEVAQAKRAAGVPHAENTAKAREAAARMEVSPESELGRLVADL